VYAVAEALDVGGLSIDAREFSKDQRPERLYKKFSHDYPNVVAVIKSSNHIDQLNALLRIPNLYERCDLANKDVRCTSFGRWLLQKTEAYRHKHFSELLSNQQRNIVRLNRLLLEDLYPDDCPRDKNLLSEETAKSSYRAKETMILRLNTNKGGEIVFENDLQLQRITFSEYILFAQDDTVLTPRGKNVLLKVGLQIKENINRTREIQILGHADPDPSSRHESNLHLAAKRAIEVFKYFQEVVGLDPRKYVMSATSYGEYKPICRTDESPVPYAEDGIEKCNDSEEKKAKNRRVELLIRYAMDEQ